MVVLTDVSTWETDDSESLVRLFVHADLLEIEGLIFTTGWNFDKTPNDLVSLIHERVDAYEKDLPNLRKRSNQDSYTLDAAHQEIGYWPSAQYLLDRTVFGSTKRGAVHIGEGNDSPGSELIIKLVDEDDDRPLWITVWGGGNTLAQAIWRVKQDRSQQDLKKFLNKLRVYTITDQDREQRTPFSDSSHPWMRREFGKDLFFIWDECAWKFQNATGKRNWTQYETLIQNHGHLGALYPKYAYGVEGDTPAFLHLLQAGLNDPNVPAQGGWGGYFTWTLSEDGETSCYTNHGGEPFKSCYSLDEHFYPATFNNFVARINWATNGTGNRNPVAAFGDDQTLNILTITPAPDTTITLDASKSTDPDANKLTFKWWVIPQAGTYQGALEIDDSDKATATLKIPSDSLGKSIHIICEVTDDGLPALTSYRRIILEPKN